jgi:chromate reductase, NAD(P)H dehydrogenase (quinone)
MAKAVFLYALCGSQRRASSNLLLLEALQDAAPAGVVIKICGMIGNLPIFNPDCEGASTPDVVEAFALKSGLRTD